MVDKPVTLTFVGTGSAITDRGRYPSGVVINTDIMVDAPPQVVSHLKKLGIPSEKLSCIFITHFHPDHVLGLVMLAQDWLVEHSREKPVLLIGPPGLQGFVINLLDAAFGKDEYSYNEVFHFHEVPVTPETNIKSQSVLHTIEDLQFEAILLKHSRQDLGYKIRRNEKIIAVSGDTGFCPGIFTLMDGSDIIVMEMTTVQQPFENHLNMLDHLPKLVERLQPEQHMFLYHLAYEDEDIYRQLRKSDRPEAEEVLMALEKDNIKIAQDFKTYIV